MGDAEIELKEEDGMCLAGGNDFEQTGVSQEEAEQICRAHPGEVMGFTFRSDSPSYCHIKKKGTTKFPSGDWTTVTVVQDLNNLPTEDLFEDEYVDEWTEDSWARPGRGEGLLDDQQICMFDEIHPCDLHQGALGDCWLISAIAALAEFPDLVQNVFSTKMIDPEGRYSLNLYDFAQQSMVQIEIDDRLATSWGKCKYVSSTPEGEIWPCLLEKGMAAINGGYPNLDGYWAVYALAQMTGCLSAKTYFHDEGGDSFKVSAPTWSGNLQDGKNDIMSWNPQGEIDTDEMWTSLCDFDSKNYIMCCDSFGNSDASLDDAGVVGCHAYSLVQAKANVAGSGFNLLQIRNPWAKQEASLPWSDDDDMWTQHPEVYDELNPTSADDGLFWIQWEDFLEHYRGIFVLEMPSQRRDPQAPKQGRVGKANPDYGKPQCVTM
jgi:hypothetical protein